MTYEPSIVQTIDGANGVICVECQHCWRAFNLSKVKDVLITKNNNLDFYYEDHHSNQHYQFDPKRRQEIMDVIKNSWTEASK